MEKYYSRRLRGKMKEIRNVNSVIIDAPAGYGKTTLVQEALKSERAVIHWIRVTGKESYQWFVRLCEILRLVDPKASKKMLALGRISRSTSEEAAEILKGVVCKSKTYVVIDNMELCQKHMNPDILNALLEHDSPNLHLILITQYLGELRNQLAITENVAQLKRSDLALNREEIRDYYRNKDIILSVQQAEDILNHTDGWIVGVQLYRRCSVESGRVISKRDIHEIFSGNFFDPLSQEDRNTLVSISVFPDITYGQICFMMHTTEMPKHFQEVLGRFPLIRYERSENTYRMYSLLQEFLRNRLDTFSMEKRKAVYHRAGLWYEKHGDIKEAVGYYYRAGDYEAILSLKLVGLLLTQYEKTSYEEIAWEISQEASDELKRKYPISMLRIAYVLFSNGRFQEFQILMEEMKVIIESMKDAALYGEWVVISALMKYPDVEEMNRCYEEAAWLLEGHCKVIDSREPYMFGCISMWYMFHTEVGKGTETGENLTKMIHTYTQLTNGNGLGADVLYRGELACMQGEYQEAQILAHQAAYLAEHGRQTVISYGAALLRGRIAIAQGDMEELFRAIQYTETISALDTFLQGSAILNYMEDSVRGMLLSMIENTEKAPEWTKQGYKVSKGVVVNHLLINHVTITDMASRGEYAEAIGIMEASLKLDPRICRLVAKHYLYLGLTLCHMAMNRRADAEEYLSLAAQTSFPDKVYGTFVRFYKPLCGVLKSTELKGLYENDIKQIKRIKKYAYQKQDSVFQELEDQNFLNSLTPREREIAILAARGLRNKEIADELYISERTVKAHMNTVFQKLNIDRRAKLVELLR